VSEPTTADGGLGAAPAVLVCDDNPSNRRLLLAIFRSSGMAASAVESGEAALASIAAAVPDVLVLDLRMPGMSGLEVLRRTKEIAPELPVVILTAHGEVPAALEATRLGAYDFLTRPLINEELVLAIRRAIEHGRLAGEVRRLRQQVNGGAALARLVGRSEGMQRVIAQIQQVAPTSSAVLIRGEPGTGKEITARAIHQQSGRADHPFIAVDCGAISEALLDQELFGDRGPAGGRGPGRPGRLAMGQGGTVFLDEVGHLPPGLQLKLVQVLREQRLPAARGADPLPLDVRFIAASTAPLEEEVKRARFSQDLLERLGASTILLPPLRERREDILPIAQRLQEEASVELRRAACRLSDEAAELLGRHSWPGNIREVRNVIRQAVLQAPGPIIEEEHIRPLLARRSHTPAEVASISAPLGRSLREIAAAASAAAERQAIIEALRLSRWNKSRAARLLKTDYKTLHVKMKNFGLRVGEPDMP
jgi:DNA-binding NtrC family response regulator